MPHGRSQPGSTVLRIRPLSATFFWRPGMPRLIRNGARPTPALMPQLTVERTIEEAQGGNLRPIYLVVGEELFFRQQVLSAMRQAVVGGGGASLNEDQFV